MKLILVLIFILYSFPAFPFGLPFIDIFPDKEKPVEEEVEEEPEFCHSALHVTGEEQKIYYIFRHPCGDIIQVGIVDESEQKIFSIRNLKIVDYYKYFGESKKMEYIEQNFPGLSPLEIYRKNR